MNIKPDFLKKIYKYLNEFIKKFKVYSAANNLDIKLEKYLNYKNGFYIEIGANDGIEQSNTLFLEKKYNWNGMLIEPSEKFEKLIKNRKNKNFFYNEACCSFSNRNKKIKFLNLNLMTIALNLSQNINIKKHIYAGKKREKNNYIFYKKGIPLNDLLILSKAPKIVDFFSLDVEGSELEVLNGIDFNKYKFKFLIVENTNIKKVKNFLSKKNYYIVKKFDGDYLFSPKGSF